VCLSSARGRSAVDGATFPDATDAVLQRESTNVPAAIDALLELSTSLTVDGP